MATKEGCYRELMLLLYLKEIYKYIVGWQQFIGSYATRPLFASERLHQLLILTVIIDSYLGSVYVTLTIAHSLHLIGRLYVDLDRCNSSLLPIFIIIILLLLLFSYLPRLSGPALKLRYC